MNRLSPLIVRRPRPLRPASGQARAVAVPLQMSQAFANARPAEWLEDLKLFATGWVGGLIFFGTLFG